MIAKIRVSASEALVVAESLHQVAPLQAMLCKVSMS